MKKIAIVAGVIVGISLIFGAVLMMSFLNINVAYEPNSVNDSVVQPVKFGHANVYLIKADNGYILVDTGMPGDTTKLDEVFDLAGVDPLDVQLIILTHGHMDHMGLTAYAKEITGADVLCHTSIADKIASGEGEPAVAQTALGHFLNFMTGILEKVGGPKSEGLPPDIVMEDRFDLSEYGIAGQVIHTPGHSIGSVSIVLDNGETLVGDMVRGEGDNLGAGMYYEDKTMLIASLEKVASFGSKTIYLSHGNHIDNITLKNAIVGMKE